METTKAWRHELLDRMKDCQPLEQVKAPLSVGSVRRLCRDVDTLEGALGELVERLDYMHGHGAYKAVWMLYAVHDRTYTGPTYIDELAKARAVLASAQPRGESDLVTEPSRAKVDGVEVTEPPWPVAATCGVCGWEFRQRPDPPYSWKVDGCYAEHHLIGLYVGEGQCENRLAAVAINKDPEPKEAT